LYTYKG
jgi:hypothetical protein